MFKGQVNRNQLQTEIPLNIHPDSFLCCNTISKVISERQKGIKIYVMNTKICKVQQKLLPGST